MQLLNATSEANIFNIHISKSHQSQHRANIKQNVKHKNKKTLFNPHLTKFLLMFLAAVHAGICSENSRHNRIRNKTASAFSKKGYEVYEEVNVSPFKVEIGGLIS